MADAIEAVGVIALLPAADGVSGVTMATGAVTSHGLGVVGKPTGGADFV